MAKGNCENEKMSTNVLSKVVHVPSYKQKILSCGDIVCDDIVFTFVYSES